MHCEVKDRCTFNLVIQTMSKKLQVLSDPVVMNFFENALDPTLTGSKHQLNPALVYFSFNEFFFFIFQKITSVDSSAFQKNLQQLDQPTLSIFLTFFEKNYNNWISQHCQFF